MWWVFSLRSKPTHSTFDSEIQMRYHGRGLVAAILAVCYGVWLIWRGIRNDIWRDVFGEAVMPRWLYFATGCLSLIAGIVLAALVLNPYWLIRA